MKQILWLRLPGSRKPGWFNRRGYFLVLWIGLVCLSAPLYSQSIFDRTAPFKYRIVFTDKDHSPFSLDNPEAFLSQKSLERRVKQGISLSANDLPVTPAYIDSLTMAGARILTVSRWFNDATVSITEDSVLQKIAGYTFVKKNAGGSIQHFQLPVYSEAPQGTQGTTPLTVMDYGSSWWQLAIHNGNILHMKGFTGRDMTIAVIDAGFANADSLRVFDNLWENGRIKGTRDFVDPGNNVFREATHGMSVLSIIGGYLPGELVGTAPDASFWLLRSEDVHSENIIEEDNWIAAAEFADSAGADIINTSLGYSQFDDTLQNHTYADMNGRTTRISIAADIAVSKGMLVVVSAGNQGALPWKYITAPADADSVLAIGAVDESRNVARFSSRGPSSDNRIKPDVMSLGQGTYVATPDGTVRAGNGTSYSAPVITGLAACLWQANPAATAMDIYNAIRESSDRFYFPDDNYGYGIPDFNLSDIIIRAEQKDTEMKSPVTAFPNPNFNKLYIFFDNPVDQPVDISLYDMAGKEVYHRLSPEVSGRKYVIIDSDLNSLQKGVYIIRITAGNISGVSKLVKY